MNWSALIPIMLGGLLLVIAWEGTQGRLWNAITAKSATPQTTTAKPGGFPITIVPHTITTTPVLPVGTIIGV